MTSDGAAYFRAMYLDHCADCAHAGVPAPTPEQWVDLIGERVAESVHDGPTNGD